MYVYVYVYMCIYWFAVTACYEKWPCKSSSKGVQQQTANSLHQGEMRRPSILWRTCPLFGCTSLVDVKNQTGVCFKIWVNLGWTALSYSISKSVLEMLDGNNSGIYIDLSLRNIQRKPQRFAKVIWVGHYVNSYE